MICYTINYLTNMELDHKIIYNKTNIYLQYLLLFSNKIFRYSISYNNMNNINIMNYIYITYFV